MKSQKTKFLAAAVAAALLTTLAVARTAHTPAAPEAQSYQTHGKVTGTTPQPNTSAHVRGLLTCGDEVSETDCMKLQSLLPM